MNHSGVHKITVPAGIFNIEIFNRSSYVPSNSQNEYATDILIKIAEDSKTHSFQNISKILYLQIEIEKEKEK